jgi:hypothetical protein
MPTYIYNLQNPEHPTTPLKASEIFLLLLKAKFVDKSRAIAALSPNASKWGGRGELPGLLCRYIFSIRKTLKYKIYYQLVK